MKILHHSDTHGCHRRLLDLPEADVVVHSGDFTMNGSEAEAIDFMNWLCDEPFRHKYSSAATTTTVCMEPTSTDLATTFIICAIPGLRLKA